MSTVKGILKGLRYISQIFEEEEEEEIQIGAPTDVKHVAHIGNDGPSTNKPSWKQSKRNAAKSYIKDIGSSARDATSNVKPKRGKNPTGESQQSSIAMESPSREPGSARASRARKNKTGAGKSKGPNASSDNFASSPGPSYERDNGKISQRQAS
ncbi:hypothetical protein DCAR_0102399 [Daucus carota subsp. sativus]|uniref:CRIB domain-containing protein n=1 Tax=Daucus carota subsp. sativus TaxID=79200 RepID=A0AAF0W512_DAUCS|nr:hypothetical protein DCAR_0102399 [Daucus carota subsp. sativus]